MKDLSVEDLYRISQLSKCGNDEKEKPRNAPLTRFISSPLPQRRDDTDQTIGREKKHQGDSAPESARISPLFSPELAAKMKALDSSLSLHEVMRVLPPVISHAISERMPDASSALRRINLNLGQPVELIPLFGEKPVIPLRLLTLDNVSAKDLKFVADSLLEKDKNRKSSMSGEMSTKSSLNSANSSISSNSFFSSVSVGNSLHSAILLRDPTTGIMTGLSLLIGRACEGVSDSISNLVESGKNLLIVGFGKSTFLRDICSKRPESIVAIDSKGDLGGARLEAHAELGRVRRISPNRISPNKSVGGGQSHVIRETLEFLSPSIVIIDELWQAEDVAQLKLAKLKKIQIIAGHPAANFEEISREHLLKHFDYVCNVINPVEVHVYDLGKKTKQIRIRGKDGIVESGDLISIPNIIKSKFV